MAFTFEYDIGTMSAQEIIRLEAIAKEQGFAPIGNAENYFDVYRAEIEHTSEDGPALRFGPLESPGVGLFCFRDWPLQLLLEGNRRSAPVPSSGAILAHRIGGGTTYRNLLDMPPGKERNEKALHCVLFDECWYQTHAFLQAASTIATSVFDVYFTRPYRPPDVVKRRPIPVELPEANEFFRRLRTGEPFDGFHENYSTKP